MKGSFLCGILVDIDEDYVHSVGISARSLIYPRVLVEEAQTNGIAQQRITCWNELDCMDKCDYYARKAHSGGLPSPPACALCSPPCPNNVAETVLTAVRALGYDIATALRLAALCLNPVACVCQARRAPCPRAVARPRVAPPTASDNRAGVHAAAPRVDRQPAQRAAGVLRGRHHDDDPRQGGRGAHQPARKLRQRRLRRPHQRGPQAHQKRQDLGLQALRLHQAHEAAVHPVQGHQGLPQRGGARRAGGAPRLLVGRQEPVEALLLRAGAPPTRARALRHPPAPWPPPPRCARRSSRSASRTTRWSTATGTSSSRTRRTRCRRSTRPSWATPSTSSTRRCSSSSTAPTRRSTRPRRTSAPT